MLVELSPVTYIAICGLVRDALLHDSDAAPLLKRVLAELGDATAGGMIPSELLEHPHHIQALRRVGATG
jgi:hypothetical protein